MRYYFFNNINSDIFFRFQFFWFNLKIIINKSSGFDALDKAAIKIVELGEPYAAFSEKMRKEVDIINITRTWKFTEENNFSSN